MISTHGGALPSPEHVAGSGGTRKCGLGGLCHQAGQHLDGDCSLGFLREMRLGDMGWSLGEVPVVC